jgi:hypothetical protein
MRLPSQCIEQSREELHVVSGGGHSIWNINEGLYSRRRQGFPTTIGMYSDTGVSPARLHSLFRSLDGENILCNRAGPFASSSIAARQHPLPVGNNIAAPEGQVPHLLPLPDLFV